MIPMPSLLRRWGPVGPRLLLPALLLAPAVLAGAPAAPPVPPPSPQGSVAPTRPQRTAIWSYSGETGPAHWAELSPAFAACASGQQQSPIDIRDARPAPYEPIHFLYRTQTLEAINDGRGVHVMAEAGGELRLGGEVFALTGLHFHSPGENLIQGQGAAAEVHLVHADGAGRQLVAVVPIQPAGRSNSTLARMVERLPMRPGERLEYRQVGINPLFILPSDKSYLTYVGSLANPPCTEPVTWVILTEPVPLESALLERLALATGGNARPAAPQNGRAVYAVRRR